MTRARLPSRRYCVREKMIVTRADGRMHRAFITCGFDPATGALREIFIRPAGKATADLAYEMDAAGILLSRLLQHGETVAELVAAMGGATPSCLIHAAVLQALAMDNESRVP